MLTREKLEQFFIKWKYPPKLGWAQNPEELWAVVETVQAISPKAILEIGVEHGRTLKVWDAVLGPGGQLVGVDIDPSPYDPMPDEAWFNQTEMIFGDSTNVDIISQVKAKIPVVDFLFIDGWHLEETPRLDWENYSPLVRSGGIVAFHDTNHVPIRQLVESIPYRKQFYGWEYGTGIVWKD